MAYAALEESVRLLNGEAPSQQLRLSRRTRHLPVAVDQDGDVAATLFLRRGVSAEAWLDVHALERAGSSWRVLGGGSGNRAGDVFGPRPSLADLDAVAVEFGAGGCVRNAGRLMPWGARWLRWVELRVADEVATLALPTREVAVAEHGVAVVVWTSRRPPVLVATDGQGGCLGQVTIGRT